MYNSTQYVAIPKKNSSDIIEISGHLRMILVVELQQIVTVQPVPLHRLTIPSSFPQSHAQIVIDPRYHVKPAISALYVLCPLYPFAVRLNSLQIITSHIIYIAQNRPASHYELFKVRLAHNKIDRQLRLPQCSLKLQLFGCQLGIEKMVYGSAVVGLGPVLRRHRLRPPRQLPYRTQLPRLPLKRAVPPP